MTKREVRQALREFLFDRPKNKWDVVLKVWNRALIIVPETLLWLAGIINNNLGGIILVHIALVIGFIVFYQFFAKGR